MFPNQMSPGQTRLAPAKFLLAAILLAAFVPSTPAADCKPKIDKNTVVVLLGIPGLAEGGGKVSLAFSVNSKEAQTGGTFSAHHAAPGRAPAADVRYSVHVVQKKSDGALIEVVVVTKPVSGAERVLTRTVFVKHNEVVEQMYLGGVSLRASFKLLPFSCKK